MAARASDWQTNSGGLLAAGRALGWEIAYTLRPAATEPPEADVCAWRRGDRRGPRSAAAWFPSARASAAPLHAPTTSAAAATEASSVRATQRDVVDRLPKRAGRSVKEDWGRQISRL